MGLIDRAIQNMDEEQAREMLSELDEEQIAQAIEWGVEEMVIPHLEDIRERAREEMHREDVREEYAKLSPEEREEVFYETLDDLVAALVMCREEPREGFAELKTMVRDPFTAEALILIFDGEDPETGYRYIDPDYEDTLKDFAATHIRWVGAMVLPEMYDQDEAQRVLDTFELESRDADSGG